MDGSITLERDRGYADVLRAYRVLLDDVEVGRIRNGERLTVAVAPGPHELRLKVDWAGSNRVRFEVASGKSVAFACGSSLRGLRMLLALFYVLLAPSKYLWLRREDGQGPAS